MVKAMAWLSLVSAIVGGVALWLFVDTGGTTLLIVASISGKLALMCGMVGFIGGTRRRVY